MTSPLTLTENIADWRKISDLPKPVKDPRIVSLEEYRKEETTCQRITCTWAYHGEPIESFEVPDAYKYKVSVAILCNRKEYLTRLIREGKIKFK